MKKVIIGLVGTIASGKGFLAKHLAKEGFFLTSLSDRVREEIDLRGLRRERSVLQDVGNELRWSFGPCVLAERSMVMVPAEAQWIVVDAIRNPGEVAYLKEVFGAKIVAIDAPVELRLAWFLKRAEERGEDSAIEADFWRANARDLGEGEDKFGQQVQSCIVTADFQIWNDGTEGLFREAERFLREKYEVDLEGRRSLKEKI